MFLGLQKSKRVFLLLTLVFLLLFLAACMNDGKGEINGADDNNGEITDVGGVDQPDEIIVQSRTIGYITDFAVSDEDKLSFDPIEWITWDEEERLNELGLSGEELDNDYHIHNPEIENISYEIWDGLVYRYLDWDNAFELDYEGDGYITTADADEFFAYLYRHDDYNLYAPFWLTITDGVLVEIEEQYIP